MGKVDSLNTELAKQGSVDSARIQLYLDLSKEYRSYNKSKALGYTDSALTLSKKIHNRKLELSSNLNIALVYFHQEEIDSSLIFSNKALDMLSKYPQLEKWEGMVYEHIGHSLYYKGNYEEALHNFLLALKADRAHGEDSRISILENKIANCYSSLHDWENALIAFQQSLDICESLHDEPGRADTYINIGTLKDDMGEYENAKEYYLKALDIYEANNNIPEMSACYTNLGDFYSNEGNYELALEYFTKSLLIDKQLNDDFGISVDIFNIAETHFALGDTSQAYNEYLQSLEMAGKNGFTQMIAYGNHALGMLSLARGNSSKAIQYGLKSLKAGKEMNNPETILSSCKLLSDAHKAQGQYKDAFGCLSEYQHLYDSIYTKEKSRQIIDISTKYETAKKDKQNAELKAKNAYQKKIQSTLIILLFISLLFLTSVFLLLVQRKKTVKKLNNQKHYFEGLIENSEDFIVVVDANRKTKYVSPSYLRKMGWSKKERMGQSPFDNIHPEDIPKLKESNEILFSGQGDTSCDFRLKDAHGNWHWMTSRGKNLLNEPGIRGVVINFWDITDRKKIEKLIEESREELSKSQIFARIGSWQFHLATGKFILSKELAILLNAGSEEVSIDVIDFIDKFINEEDKEFINQRIAEAAKSQDITGYTDRFQIKVKTDNPKGYLITELWGTAIAPGIIKGVTQDITEKVEAEQKIIDSEKSYRELFDKAFDAIYILDEQGKFIDVNKGAEKMYAYPKDFFIGKTPEFLSAPGKNNLEEVGTKINEAFDGVSCQFEFWGIDKNGRQFPKVVKLAPATYFGEKVVIAFAMDVTELVNTQKLISQKEKEYQRIFNAFPDIYFKSSYNREVLEVSPSAYDISGFTREEIIGKPSKDFYYLEEDYRRLGKLIVENGSIKDVDFKLRIKGNKYLNCSLSGKLIFGEDGEPLEVEGVIRDISQRVKALKKLVESEEKLKEANLTKDKVFSIISHDLRGPISTNKSIVDLIVNEFEKIGKEEIYRLLESYKPTADATYFLLENLLSWSQTQMEQISFHPGLNHVNALVEENVELYSSHAKSKDIKLSSSVQLGLIGFFDKAMLDIVIRNLISNAIKFTQKGGKVEIKSSINGNFIYLSVVDSGVGIPKSRIKNIFGDLDSNKITSAGTENEKGAGLGLVLCKEFIELNGGEIKVESKEDKGTTFTFSVPLYNY
jgi:PAS domain S-box-containing protein